MVTEIWYGIELWIPGPGFWWSSGTRFDTPEEAEKRAAEVPLRESRITKFTLTREPLPSTEVQ